MLTLVELSINFLMTLNKIECLYPIQNNCLLLDMHLIACKRDDSAFMFVYGVIRERENPILEALHSIQAANSAAG